MVLTIGAAQTEPSRGDVTENLEKHLRLVRLAAKHEVQALVFPELSLTGYELDLAERLAFAEKDGRLEPLRRAASDHNMVLVVGAPVRLSSGLHIGAFIVYPDRSMALYTKHHLGGEEPEVFQPFDRNHWSNSRTQQRPSRFAPTRIIPHILGTRLCEARPFTWRAPLSLALNSTSLQPR